MYFAAFCIAIAGIAVAILGYQLSLRPGVFARPHRAAALRFTEAETSAVAAMLRFHGLIAIAVALIAAMYETAIS